MIECEKCQKKIKRNKNSLCFGCYLKSPIHPNNLDKQYAKPKAELRKCKSCTGIISWANAYDYCRMCYNNSPEAALVSKNVMESRRKYNGSKNPHYRGGLIKKICLCEKEFEVYPARKDTAKYCSRTCKKKYSVSMTYVYEYKGINLRSSYELAYAQYLDNNGYHWEFEPESFKTDYGFYTPDFWIEELQTYVEVKGYFRKDAKLKFDDFSKDHRIILADRNYLLDLGLIIVKSGPKKGQMLCP